MSIAPAAYLVRNDSHQYINFFGDHTPKGPTLGNSYDSYPFNKISSSQYSIDINKSTVSDQYKIISFIIEKSSIIA